MQVQWLRCKVIERVEKPSPSPWKRAPRFPFSGVEAGANRFRPKCEPLACFMSERRAREPPISPANSSHDLHLSAKVERWTMRPLVHSPTTCSSNMASVCAPFLCSAKSNKGQMQIHVHSNHSGTRLSRTEGHEGDARQQASLAKAACLPYNSVQQLP